MGASIDVILVGACFAHQIFASFEEVVRSWMMHDLDFDADAGKPCSLDCTGEPGVLDFCRNNYHYSSGHKQLLMAYRTITY